MIGGAPAGAALAARLAQLGHSVVLLEKHCFPRPHVGESLVAEVLPLLEVLDVRSEVENAGFLRPAAAQIRWGGTTEWRENAGAPGFQVDRGKFDQILLQGASRAGAVVLQPVRVLDLQRQKAGGWRIKVRHTTGSSILSARIVADATGRVGILGGRRKSISCGTLALYAYWKQVSLNGPETRIEAGNDEWFWGAPLPHGEFNATAFIDSPRYAGGVSRTGGLEAFYRSLISNSALLAGCLQGCLATPVRVCDATSFQDENPVAQDAIKVGEASFSIDPLSSQGVQAALGSALHAAAVLHTMMVHPQNAALAFEFYCARQSQSVLLHANAAASFYREAAESRPGEFWARRASRKYADPGSAQAPSRSDGNSELHLSAIPDERREIPALSLDPQTRIRLSPDVHIETAAALRNDVIVPATVLVPPAAAAPIAFLGNMEVDALLPVIRSSLTVGQLLATLSTQLRAEDAITLFRWLCAKGILICG